MFLGLCIAVVAESAFLQGTAFVDETWSSSNWSPRSFDSWRSRGQSSSSGSSRSPSPDSQDDPETVSPFLPDLGRVDHCLWSQAGVVFSRIEVRLAFHLVSTMGCRCYGGIGVVCSECTTGSLAGVLETVSGFLSGIEGCSVSLEAQGFEYSPWGHSPVFALARTCKHLQLFCGVPVYLLGSTGQSWLSNHTPSETQGSCGLGT